MCLTLRELPEAFETEWVITNGLGGYASSTVLGLNTRKYHGLLIIALNPPVNRWVLLAGFEEEIIVGDKTWSLGPWESEEHLPQLPQEFCLDLFPSFKFELSGLEVQKTILMTWLKNLTATRYIVTNGLGGEVLIQVSPLVSFRRFHEVSREPQRLAQAPLERGVVIQPPKGKPTLALTSTQGVYRVEERWIKNIRYRADASRGEPCLDSCFKPGSFEVRVEPGKKREFWVLAAAGETEELEDLLSADPGLLHQRERERKLLLLHKFQARHPSLKLTDWLKWLLLAADSFLVHRASSRSKSVIAGYPWFGDWGRDALISLPGLTLATGRFLDARAILLTFKHHCKNGLVPNYFPEQGEPLYNSVDATLWYFNSVLQYLKYTGDFDFVRLELWPTLKSMVNHHLRGTNHGIRVDEDGLLSHGPQLTWMDTSTTPREGKAVEVQALWYNALKMAQLLALRFGEEELASQLLELAGRAKQSFLEQFWNPDQNCLYDVVRDSDRDGSLRPNQILAVALDFRMLDPTQEKQVVETVWKKLWTARGLRTLPKDDPRYRGAYSGNRAQRDTAYHNGTIWPWLLGPFCTAFLRTRNHEPAWRRFAFENFLRPLFQHHIHQAGLGTLSEIFDGDPPHAPRGAISQAWSVAEPLRAYFEDVLLRRPLHEQEVLSLVSTEFK